MIAEFPVHKDTLLLATSGWAETVHVFEEEDNYALRAALASQRPLLVRGEPGTGKSQLARAAAQVLKRLFVAEVVHARSECQDLLWSFDAVARLGEAQAMAAAGKSQQELEPRRYLSPGALWWVFNWGSAQQQYEMCQHKMRRPQPLANWRPEHGSVLLIDEIDKADVDLPNGLLETLGNGAFSVPYLDKNIGLSQDIERPLVVITTNEERELPAAFVRRCMVLHLSLPKEQDALVQRLMSRGQSHFAQLSSAVRKKSAQLLWDDRQEALRQGISPPGQAEYLDMLRAVSQLADTEIKQLAMLDKISDFALKKFTGMMD